jgi:hypothetical protein
MLRINARIWLCGMLMVVVIFLNTSSAAPLLIPPKGGSQGMGATLDQFIVTDALPCGVSGLTGSSLYQTIGARLAAVGPLTRHDFQVFLPVILNGYAVTGDVYRPVLELAYVDDGQLVWQGPGGAFYRPLAPDGFHALGHYYAGGGAFMLVARELEPGRLATPDHYEWVLSRWDVGIWRPVPRPGYVCLGLVAQAGVDPHPPSVDEVRCVDQTIVAPGEAGSEIWSFTSDYVPLYSWHVVPADTNGIPIGAFTAGTLGTDPPDDLYVLDARWVSGGDAGFGPEDVERLIQQYGPILYLHPDEEYYLDDPEWVLDQGVSLAWAIVENEWDYDTHAELYPGSKNTCSRGLMHDVEYVLNNVRPNPPYNDSPSFRYWLHIPYALCAGDLSWAKAIVRVVQYTVLTEIQFWFFYPCNGPGRVTICASSGDCDDLHLDTNGRHYGDWENVTLRFLNTHEELVSVYMSAHEGGYWFYRPDFGVRLQFEDAHPVVYAAKYSHAHYATVGKQYYKRLWQMDYWAGTASVDLFDLTSAGLRFDTSSSDSHRVVSSDAYHVYEPRWLGFVERWGQYEQLSTTFWLPPIPAPVYTYEEVGAGPKGPAGRDEWKLGYFCR